MLLWGITVLNPLSGGHQQHVMGGQNHPESTCLWPPTATSACICKAVGACVRVALPAALSGANGCACKSWNACASSIAVPLSGPCSCERMGPHVSGHMHQGNSAHARPCCPAATVAAMSHLPTSARGGRAVQLAACMLLVLYHWTVACPWGIPANRCHRKQRMAVRWVTR